MLSRREALNGALSLTVLSSAAAAGAPDSHPQPAPAPAVPSGPSPGVGAWYGSRVDFLLGDSGASWYYTWAPHHDWITTPAGCEFVPMILGRQDVTAAIDSHLNEVGYIIPGLGDAGDKIFGTKL